MFNEFEMDKPSLASTVEGTGDVKYHLGTSQTRHLPSGKLVCLSPLSLSLSRHIATETYFLQSTV